MEANVNFQVAQKTLERLEKNASAKYVYKYGYLRDVTPGDIQQIANTFLEIAETEKDKKCCQAEDMRPYKGQGGRVSNATHFCRWCGQHWIFAGASKPDEQEWFSATPAMPAKIS
jgi:hypothetical protein